MYFKPSSTGLLRAGKQKPEVWGITGRRMPVKDVSQPRAGGCVVLMDALCHLAALSSTDSTGLLLCTDFAGFVFANLFSSLPHVLIVPFSAQVTWVPLFQLVAYLAWLNLYTGPYCVI